MRILTKDEAKKINMNFVYDNKQVVCIDSVANLAHYCDCGKYLGCRGLCSQKCLNKHYDGYLASFEKEKEE